MNKQFCNVPVELIVSLRHAIKRGSWLRIFAAARNLVDSAACNPNAEALQPVEGDLLPPVGSTVLIHLASPGKWVEREVVGYYVWGDLGGQENLHRVFVRVKDKDGHLNARPLNDIRLPRSKKDLEAGVA